MLYFAFLPLLRSYGGPPNMSTPLNQWPMIQVHDSATGYLTLGNIVSKVVVVYI